MAIARGVLVPRGDSASRTWKSCHLEVFDLGLGWQRDTATRERILLERLLKDIGKGHVDKYDNFVVQGLAQNGNDLDKYAAAWTLDFNGMVKFVTHQFASNVVQAAWEFREA